MADYSNIGTITFAELCKMDFSESEPEYKTDLVKILYESLEIELTLPDNGAHYYIDIETITDAGHLLDWVFQLYEKAWVTPGILHDFLEAINHLCKKYHGTSAQGAFCPSGQSKKVDWAGIDPTKGGSAHD